MRRLLKTLCVAACLLAAPVWASDDHGSREEATAMVRRAADYLKANGAKKTYAAVNDSNGQFRDRDLYVFVIDMNGTVQAHGANPKLIDKDLSVLKDADDKLFIKAMIDIAKVKGRGWVDYKWPNPVSKVIESKSTYVEKIDEVFIGCGIYR